jgi:Ca-activated chloride channel family protein
MTFAAPLFLLALLLVPAGLAVHLLLQRRRERYVVRFTNVALLENLVPRQPSWRRHVPTALYLAAAADFLDRLPDGYRVALVAFSTEARLVVPPTTDRGQVRAALDSLRADGGTALGDAITLALDAAGLVGGTAGQPAVALPGGSPTPSPDPSAGEPEPPLVAAVLLSDGKGSTGAVEPLDAATQAAAQGVPIYTIALGTQTGTVDVPDGLGGSQTIPVPPDTETLGQIADMTGGRFFEAPTSEELAAVYQGLGSRVGVELQEQEVTQWFAAGALLLVLGGAGLAALWFNRIP